MSNPKIENAPGLVFKPRKEGFEARWQARTDLIRRGYPLKSAAICTIGPNPSDTEKAFISDRCNALQSEMLVWGRGGLPNLPAVFDGTLKSLIARYQDDPDSTFHTMRFNSRTNYINLMRRLEKDFGDEHLAEVKGRTVKHWHEHWTADGKHIAMGHGLIGMLRTLLTFGTTLLESQECARLKGILSDMRFTMPKARTERITAQQVNAVRAKAHELGRHSIALAQAFQFEGILRQKDVIGEWVPASEPGLSEVTYQGDKWLRGVRWSEIDGDLILRHTTSKKGKDIEVDLKLAPMVLEELQRMGDRPKTGPIIVYEKTGIPYRSAQFRKVWRLIATAAGVPDAVFNMDSRAGAISEATDAGADLEHVRQAATHSDIKMTQRYSRNAVEKTANVQRIRSAHRTKNV
jgi:hypothetical protein